MAAKLTRLTHKIAIQLQQWQRAVPFAVLAPGGRSGNFWIHHRKHEVWYCSVRDMSRNVHKDKIQLASFVITGKIACS
jgi:hypothetical protein